MEYLKNILKHYKCPVFLLKDNKVIAFNEEFEKICPEILKNKNISDIFRIEKEELKSGSIRIKNNNEVEFKLYLSEFDKQIADFLITIYEYKQDINEFQISNTDSNFYNFYNSSIDPVIIVQPDGTIVSFNKAAKETAQLYNLFTGKISNIFEINLFDDIKNSLLSPNNYKKRATIKHTLNNGTIFHYDYVVQPLIFNRKKALTIIFNDVSENKNLINKIHTSKKKYRQILNSVFDGIILTNDLHIEFWNDSAEKITGYSKEDVIGKPIFSVFKKEVESLQNLQQINNYTDNADELNYVKKMLTKNGEEIIIDISISNVIDDTGLKKTIGVFKDITEQYIADEKIKRNEKKLREVNTALSSFFSILAHDMRTPTIQIMGLSELLLENSDTFSAEDQKKYLSMLNLSSKNSLELLDTLVEWGRTMTNKITFKPETFKIDDIIEKTLRLNQIQFESKEIKSEFESSSLNVFADMNMVFTIFNNLISNAIKFSYKNSRIIIEVQTTEDYVHISVKDFGIGIKNIEDIFKYNKKTIVLGTEDEKGKGIGLMFSAELVKKNNGKIWVESELEKGSTFYFTLPKG